MIHATIGLPAARKGMAPYDAIQDWLRAHGMSPYMPHLRYTSSYNIGMMTDVVGRTLAQSGGNSGHGLPPEAMAEMRRFGYQSFYHYNTYYYRDRPDTLRWLGADGVSRNQDQLAQDEIRDYLSIARAWLDSIGVRAYIFVDELPHPGAADNPSRWGWTPEIERRGLKFVAAAMAAGLDVVFAAPPAAAVEYWHGKGLRPSVWAIQDDVAGHDAKLGRVLPLVRGTPVWLYNSVNVTGLADRIRAYNPETAGGYLHWSAQWADAPLFTAAGAPTELMWALISQLERAEAGPQPKPEATWQDHVAELRSQVTELRSQVAALTSRVQSLEEKAAPEVGKQRRTALFYSSAVADWQRDLPALERYDRAVINVEMATATHNSRGEPYTDGRTPLDWLQDRGVEVWLYVSPWWVWTAAPLSGPGEQFRQAQLETAAVTGAWLLDAQGKRVTAYNGKMAVIDARNEAYRSWLAMRLAAVKHVKLFMDQAWPHQQYYHAFAVTDAEWVEAVSHLYRALRADGKRIMLNGGWEMADPAAAAWTYPFAGLCDAVAIECPGGFRAPDGWWDIWEPRGRRLDRLTRVAARWRSLGRDVLIVARPQTPAQLEQDRTYWQQTAQDLDLWWCCQTDYMHIPEVK